MAPAKHECSQEELLSRLENKIDKILESQSDIKATQASLKGRILAHEMVAGSLLAIAGLVAAFLAIKGH